MSFNKEQELEDALEQQIDIVLKLEEERIELQKKNNIYKNEISQLKKEINTDKQKEKPYQEAGCQTLNFKKKMTTQESQTDIIKENQTSQIKKQLNSSRQPTKKPIRVQQNNKENIKQQTQTAIAPVSKDQDIIAEELKRLTKENRSLKLQERQQMEIKKKIEKENMELSTQIEIKNQNLTKLKNEITEISSLLNTDKFKTIKIIEQKLSKECELNKELKKIIEEKNQEQFMVNEELLQFKQCLNKIQNDYEQLVNKQQSNISQNYDNSAEIEELQQKNREIQEANQFTNQQLQLKGKMLEELSIQINKMNEEIEFYKSISLSAKSQAEKATNDAEYYKLQYFNLRNSSYKV